MAAISDLLFLVTMLIYTVAMVAFAADLAFRRRPVPPVIRSQGLPRTPDPRQQRQLVTAGAAETTESRPVAAPASRTAGPVPPPTPNGSAPGRLSRVAVGVTLLGWVAHLATVLSRGVAAGRVPWGNMYEFSTLVAFVAVTALLVLLRRQQARWLGTFVLVPVVLYLGLAGTVLYQPAGPLMPALNSYWLKIHVVAAMTATGLFFVSGVVALLYLAKDRRSTGPLLARLPSAAALDRTAHGLIAFAFPIWSFAVIAGAIWAEAAWGRYWGWDPKETWSFITWVIYAGYLHARSTAGWRGRRAAWFAVAAFASLIVNYYAVNIWIVGLHSYAGVG